MCFEGGLRVEMAEKRGARLVLEWSLDACGDLLRAGG